MTMTTLSNNISFNLPFPPVKSIYIIKDENNIKDLNVFDMNFSGKEMEYKENLPKVLFYPFL